MGKQTVHLIAAARPNFIKVAPLWHALSAADDFAPGYRSIPVSIATPT